WSQSNEKYGSDKNQCLRNYSLYKGYFQNKDYEDAKMFWQKMIKICPEYSTGIWSDGEKIYKAEIKSVEDPLKKNQLIDSLIWIYDQRILYFGDNPRFSKGYILGKKGVAIMNYGIHPVSEAYEALLESVTLQRENSYPAVILTLMKATKNLFSSGIIDAEEVISNYSTCMSIAEANLLKSPDNKNFTAAVTGIEQYLISSKAADCPILIEIFSDQFQENKDSSEWLSKTIGLLKSTGCIETSLYSQSQEALFVLEPSAKSAHKLANMHFTGGNFDKALEYLTRGVEIGENSEEKASMYYELAYINYTQFNDYIKARDFALKASELRPNWGDPYILIGKMYIDDRKSVSREIFEQEAVFWAAVDKFIMAKKVDPEQSKRANELINQYSQYFPNNEDVFMWTYKDGKTYRVGGWINEQTKVRSRKL
ncbi:tetratricopeptide repeat protein, partial [bacterium]|nr:tetratricopeptide repeat protein [bacterium]